MMSSDTETDVKLILDIGLTTSYTNYWIKILNNASQYIYRLHYSMFVLVHRVSR